MKKVFLITILCLFVILVNGVVFAEEYAGVAETKADTAKFNIAIIPYINSTEEKKGYIQEIIDNKYTSNYSGEKFQKIPLVDVQRALSKTGYNSSNMELPDKDILSAVAKETNADYVIAMEVSQLITTRHMSFFQIKVVTKAKLHYKFYDAKQDKVISFQVTGASENKAIIGDVGYKDPITKALNQAMDDANEKIMSNL